MAALLSTLRDSQDIVKELEDPGVDPSLIKQQIEAAEVSLRRGGEKKSCKKENVVTCMKMYKSLMLM